MGQQQLQRHGRSFLKLILFSSLGVLGVLLTLALSAHPSQKVDAL
jgi:hypothetical protein